MTSAASASSTENSFTYINKLSSDDNYYVIISHLLPNPDLGLNENFDPKALSVVHKNHYGEIWIEKDKSDNVCSCLVASGLFHVLYGKINSVEALHEYCTYIVNLPRPRYMHRINKDVYSHLITPEELLNKLSPFKPVTAPSYHYTMDFKETDFVPPLIPNNSGFKLCQITPELFPKCSVYAPFSLLAGPNFEKGFGYCLYDEKDDIVVSEVIFFRGKTEGEIGVSTHEKYRQRGFAPITVNGLIQYLYNIFKTSSEPNKEISRLVWTCEQSNIASMKTAEKNGFSPKHRVEWELTRMLKQE